MKGIMSVRRLHGSKGSHVPKMEDAHLMPHRCSSTLKTSTLLFVICRTPCDQSNVPTLTNTPWIGISPDLTLIQLLLIIILKSLKKIKIKMMSSRTIELKGRTSDFACRSHWHLSIPTFPSPRIDAAPCGPHKRGAHSEGDGLPNYLNIIDVCSRLDWGNCWFWLVW